MISPFRPVLFLCLWLASSVVPAWAQETDVDQDPAVQEKLKDFKKRVFASIQLADLEEKYPLTGDTKVRRAAIHKIKAFFRDNVAMQIDCAILELGVDGKEGRSAFMAEPLAALRKEYGAKMKPEQNVKVEYMEASVAWETGQAAQAQAMFIKVARNKAAAQATRLSSYRLLAESYITQAKPSEAAKILAEAGKSLDDDVAPMLEPIKAGVLIFIGQKDQARRVWKECAEKYGANSGPIYNVGLEMISTAAWVPIGDEILTIMTESARKLPFFKEVENATTEARKKLEATGKGGLLAIAMGQERQGNHEQALATYARMPSTDESYLRAAVFRGILLAETGKSGEANRCFAELCRQSGVLAKAGLDLEKEAKLIWLGSAPLQPAYQEKAGLWWPKWEALATQLGLTKSSAGVMAGGAWMDAVAKQKPDTALVEMLPALARWSRWNPVLATEWARQLTTHKFPSVTLAGQCVQLLLALEQAVPTELALSKAMIIEAAFKVNSGGQFPVEDPAYAKLCTDFLALNLSVVSAPFVNASWNCASHALLHPELQAAAAQRLELVLAGAPLRAGEAQQLRQVLSMLYAALKDDPASERVLLQDNAWPLPEALQKIKVSLKPPDALAAAQMNSLLALNTIKGSKSLLTQPLGLDPSGAPAIPKAGPYGPALKATMAQLKPVWFDHVAPESTRDTSIRDEKKFLTTEDPSIALWNRFKASFLYAADPDKSQDIRRTSVIQSAACAYYSSRTKSQLQPWLGLTLTKSMDDPLNYSVEMRLLELAISERAPGLVQQMYNTLQVAASEPVHDSRLDAYPKIIPLHLELYNLTPDEAKVAEFRTKVFKAPMENDRAQLITPTMTFLVHHGMTKSAAAWREAALASVANDPKDVKNVGTALDNVTKTATTWRTIHEALCEVLWKHVDKASVTKPSEVDEILHLTNVGMEYSPATLRNIYCYYLKQGGLFWQPTHWHHLISETLPNEEPWLALKKELCAKMLAVAPTDELRAEFSRRFPHYFPLYDPANRALLKEWMEPFRDLKKNPFMGQSARWADLNSAFATMDEEAMKVIANMPPDTADPLDRRWRTIAAVVGRRQAADVAVLLKDLPEAAFNPFMYQGVMLRALKLVKDEKRLAKVSKEARATVKGLVGRIWVNRDLELLPTLIDLVDALDAPELLPAAFIKEMRSLPYLPISAPANAWFHAMSKSWTECKAAAELALKVTEGDPIFQPEMLLLLGFAEAQLGHKAEAVTALDTFLQQAPASVHYYDALELRKQMQE